MATGAEAREEVRQAQLADEAFYLYRRILWRRGSADKRVWQVLRHARYLRRARRAAAQGNQPGPCRQGATALTHLST